MNYQEYLRQAQAEINAFPMRFAFSDAQLVEGLKSLGATLDEVVGIGGGGFIRRSDLDRYRQERNGRADRLAELLKDDAFLHSALVYELANTEYCISYDETDALESLGVTLLDPRVKRIFEEARKEYMKGADM